MFDVTFTHPQTPCNARTPYIHKAACVLPNLEKHTIYRKLRPSRYNQGRPYEINVDKYAEITLCEDDGSVPQVTSKFQK